METISQIVGNNLVALRKAKGMTQMQLAEEIHYSDKSISKWENGYALPPVDILMDFAQYYGVTLDYLCKKQEAEDIASVIDDQNHKKEEAYAKRNKIGMMAIVPFALLFLTSLILISDYINEPYGDRHYWMIMIWAFPIIFALEAVMTKLFFGKLKWLITMFSSLALWAAIIVFILHFQIWEGQNVWYIIVAGGPMQAIIIILYFWKRR